MRLPVRTGMHPFGVDGYGVVPTTALFRRDFSLGDSLIGSVSDMLHVLGRCWVLVPHSLACIKSHRDGSCASGGEQVRP